MADVGIDADGELEATEKVKLDRLLAQAAVVGPHVEYFDANDPIFSSEGDMPAGIAQWCGEAGPRTERSRAEFARSGVESPPALWLGNVLVHGRALAKVEGSLEFMRDLVRRTFTPRTSHPSGSTS